MASCAAQGYSAASAAPGYHNAYSVYRAFTHKAGLVIIQRSLIINRLYACVVAVRLPKGLTLCASGNVVAACCVVWNNYYFLLFIIAQVKALYYFLAKAPALKVVCFPGCGFAGFNIALVFFCVPGFFCFFCFLCTHSKHFKHFIPAYFLSPLYLGFKVADPLIQAYKGEYVAALVTAKTLPGFAVPGNAKSAVVVASCPAAAKRTFIHIVPGSAVFLCYTLNIGCKPRP